MLVVFRLQLLICLSTLTYPIVCVGPAVDCFIFNGTNCYFFPSDHKYQANPIVNQTIARELCVERGGDLVSIHSAEERVFFEDLVGPITHWLGIRVQFQNNSINSLVSAIWNSDGTAMDHASPLEPGFEYGSCPWANYTDFFDEPNNFLQSVEYTYCTDVKGGGCDSPRDDVFGWETQDCGVNRRVVCKKLV